MKKYLFTAFLFTVFVFALGSAVKAQSVGINGSIGAVKRGSSTRGKIVMAIPGGLHANSNRPGSEYAIPTVIKVSADGAKVGSVVYPRGKNRKLAFSEETINVYEGRAYFFFNVAVPAKFKGSVVKIPVTVRYQACTDEVCYPPKNKEIVLTAKVR